MKKLFLAFLLGLPMVAQADTIRVDRAWMTEPVKIFSPYQVDSLSAKRAKFDLKEVFSNNASAAFLTRQASTEVLNGTALSALDSTATLRLVRFPLSASRFVKAKISVKNLASYKLYVDEKEVSGGEVKLLPGTSEVALLCLTQPTAKDTFSVSIEGKNLAGLTLPTYGDKRAYTMAEMLEGDRPYSVSVSPDGKYLVASYYNKKSDGSNQFRTVLSELSTGRELMRFGEYKNLQWLPTRSVLYFTRTGAQGTELVYLDPQTMNETVVAQGLPTTSFTLSPTEDYFIYSKTTEGEKENGSLRRIQEPDDRMPGWRNCSELYRYDLKTGLAQRLTFGETGVGLNDISADGKWLLLSFSRMDTRRAPFRRATFVRMDAYTGRVDTLLADTAFVSQAKFSPDAKQLLIKATPAAFEGIGSEVAEGQTPQGFDYRLYIYDIDTKRVRPVLRGFAPSVESFHWHAVDNTVYFSATDGADISIFSLSPTTEKVQRYQLPITYVQGYSIARGMKKPRMVFHGQTGERAREMYLCTLSAAQPKSQRIGETNFDEQFANVAIGTCHDWSFLSSRGDSIRGFYFLPPDFDKSKKYPLIVYYYGGCTPTPKMLEFQFPLQVLAAQGYVVYACQPSGAIGFGQEFAARHVGTWGQGSADDIIEGTKAFCAEHPYVNAEKIGCMGASYGGFMTQYLQTRTDIFAAAISHAGISNIASYWGGGYWGYTYGEVAQYGSYPWNNPELYVKQSPLFNADKINTPLLLLHGTVDTNVPTDESQQLFTALRILGKRVSYIHVNGENHVITNHTKRLAWQNAIFAWMAYWLKDEPEWWEDLYPTDKFGQDK